VAGKEVTRSELQRSLLVNAMTKPLNVLVQEDEQTAHEIETAETEGRLKA